MVEPMKMLDTRLSRTRVLKIRPWIMGLFIAFMLSPMSQAEPNPNDKEIITVAHPEQVGMGQPFLVRLTSSQAFETLSIHWMGRKMVPSVSQWNNLYVAIALLGTDVLTIKPGRQPLEVRALAGGKQTVRHGAVQIVSRTYPRQELALPPQMVTPPAAELKRITAERVRTQKAKDTWSDQRLWHLPFHRPVKGRITSVYGLKRVLNGTPKNPHRGIDFKASEGTAIEAVADGRVILAESHYYAGSSVYIDHGNGVISLYFHLSKFEVVAGDRVKRGQVIGRAGSTGRSTAPHLHLSVCVQGQLVDPLPLLKETTDDLVGP